MSHFDPLYTRARNRRDDFMEEVRDLQQTKDIGALRMALGVTVCGLALLAKTSTYLATRALYKAGDLLLTLTAFALVYGVYYTLMRPAYYVLNLFTEAAIARLDADERLAAAGIITAAALTVYAVYRICRWAAGPMLDTVETFADIGIEYTGDNPTYSAPFNGDAGDDPDQTTITEDFDLDRLEKLNE